MPKTRAEMKAELQVEAKRLIDAQLHWIVQTNAPDLNAIEDEVPKWRRPLAV